MSLVDLEEVEQKKFEIALPPDLPISLPSRQSVGHRPISIWRRTRLIIAIDFGTTYSGASFALLHPTDAPENAKVSVVRNWKGELPGNTTSNKVPTLIAYDENEKPHWGFDIPSELDDATVKWVKLVLEPEIHARGTFNDTGIIDPDISKRTLERLRHGAIEAASDYVRLLWEHVQAQIINEHSQATYNFAEKSVVFSVPAVWSETAKHNTYLVAAGAGLASPDLNLQTISEPEAAAMAVLKERAPFLKLDDSYIVVDAGGGTVDLTSYVLKSISPLRLEEIIAGDGDVCGAVLLELNFLKLLRTYLTAEVLDALPPENLNRIINDFETGVRKAFDGEDRTNYTVAMPGVPENSCAKIKAGLLRLTAAELKPVFRPVVEKVERLVRKQIQQLRAQNRTPTAILLVGGFGTNRYLAKCLKRSYEENASDASDRIEVLQPNIGWESIANGAVRCEAIGIGNIVSLRVSRFNVGIVFDTNWNEERDSEVPERRYVCPFHGKVMVSGRMQWYLRRGEKIQPGFQVDFPMDFLYYDHQLRGKSKIYLTSRLLQSSEDDAPSRTTPRTKPFVSIEFPWDLERYPYKDLTKRTSLKGRSWRKFSITIHMVQGPAKMEFHYSVGTERRGEAQSVNFHDLAADSGDDLDSETDDGET